jgi:hypothetical protein
MREMNEDKRCWGLLRRRSCLMPTWRGWVLGLLGFILVAVLVVREVHPFLAVNHPVDSKAMVIEGWLPDYALEVVVREFNRGNYEKLYVTGGPIEWGAPLSEYKTYAQRGAAILLKMGLSTNVIQAVPGPHVRQDRTYAAAVAFHQWLVQNGVPLKEVNLMSLGPHARRSWLLFEKGLGKDVMVGVTAIPIEDYDERRWWKSSQGVRMLIDESVAYAYARIFFRTPKSEL